MYTRLFIIAVIPGIAIAIGFYLTDRFDKEPVKLLLKTFIFGCLSVIPTGIFERILMSFNIFKGLLSSAFTAFIIAGLTEEFLKREVVLRISYRSKHFNEKLDGIIYSVYAALGFATIENIMYVVFRFSANKYIGIYRGILSVPAHMLFAVTMGYYLSLAKYSLNKTDSIKYLNKSLYVPVVLHGIFDFILMANIQMLMGLFIPYVIYLWIFNLRKLNEYYKESKTLFKYKTDDDNLREI